VISRALDKPSVVTHAYSHSTREVEAEGSDHRFHVSLGYRSETLSPKYFFNSGKYIIDK
jgi:hypothetical protein